MPGDIAISSPSADTAMASITPVTRSANDSSSQFRFWASALRFAHRVASAHDGRVLLATAFVDATAERPQRPQALRRVDLGQLGRTGQPAEQTLFGLDRRCRVLQCRARCPSGQPCGRHDRRAPTPEQPAG